MKNNTPLTEMARLNPCMRGSVGHNRHSGTNIGVDNGFTPIAECRKSILVYAHLSRTI